MSLCCSFSANPTEDFLTKNAPDIGKNTRTHLDRERKGEREGGREFVCHKENKRYPQRGEERGKRRVDSGSEEIEVRSD